MANIALADDHILLRNGLAALVKNQGHHVLFEADNGIDFINKIAIENTLPDIVLMDINMPEMDGYKTTQWLKEKHTTVQVLALSMYDNENSIIRMLRCGARGYILKDSEPIELKNAIEAILNKGFYYSDLVNGKLLHAINHLEDTGAQSKLVGGLTDRETSFLKYSCTELTYKEIADKMYVSPRTIDGYRDALFEKLQIKTRVGLAMYAIKVKLVILD
jgi:two-component system, NarL family, invasion response regulator UvrY